MTRLDPDLGGTDGAWVWLYPPGSKGPGPFGTTYSKQLLQPGRSRCTRDDSVLGTFGQVFLLSVPGLIHFCRYISCNPDSQDDMVCCSVRAELRLRWRRFLSNVSSYGALLVEPLASLG